MASITLEEVSKTYPNGFKAVSSLSLEVADGEFMVLVGPSGCGKTTLLRMIAGLEDITEGVMRIGDKVVNELSPKDRDVAMVFQNYALYPHMTVAENVGFALKLRKVPKAQIKAKVEQAAAILGLTEWLDRKPAQLSGGQRQRVAMGRAIVREPSIFLMDEPLSNLDAKLRVQMRAEVSRIQRQVGVATVYVTHDQTEAMTMGDRVAVLRGGVLQQCDAPQVLYDRPANMFVGAFIGSPAMNLYEAQVSAEANALRIGSQEVPLEESVLLRRRGLSKYGGRSVVVGFRPENVSVGAGPGPALVGEVELVESLGAEMLVHFKLDARRVIAEGAVDDEADSVLLAGEGIARVDPRVEVKPGRQATFRVDMAYAHFFDPESGEAIWN